MKKLIFNAFAYIDDQSSPVNLNKIKKDDIIEAYLKCSVVSLISAKYNNQDCEVALVTNIKVPNKFKYIFDKYDIKIFNVEYNDFNFNKDMKWSAAFYKLCALNSMVNKLDYDQYIMLDTDTYTNGSFRDLWIECDKKILLYDIQHNLSNIQSIQMNKEYLELYGENIILTNYGGECIAGSKVLLQEFVEKCREVYLDMIKRDINTLHGDEFIICCVAQNMPEKIKSANAYIYRYWTGIKFYLVSTNFIYNKVSILHLPEEKDRAFDYLYKYIIKKGKLPKENILFRKLGFPKAKRRIDMWFIYNVIKKRVLNC